MNLPIDVVSDRPLKFRWYIRVDGVMQECSGELPSSAEQAVADLIGRAKQLALENTDLKKRLETVLTPKALPTKGTR